jgi:UDP-N-acetylglucosamine enolpyruvyl transferase
MPVCFGIGGGKVDSFVIKGGESLHGRLRVGGAKNASLPILAASLLACGSSTVEDVPELLDVCTHPHQLCNVHEPVFKDGLRYH